MESDAFGANAAGVAGRRIGIVHWNRYRSDCHAIAGADLLVLTQGHTSRVLELIENTLSRDINTVTRTTLNDFRSWVLLLGQSPVPTVASTTVTSESTQIGSLAESVRLFLVGNAPAGVETVILATARDAVDVSEENSAADLMPPFIETYTRR